MPQQRQICSEKFNKFFNTITEPVYSESYAIQNLYTYLNTHEWPKIPYSLQTEFDDATGEIKPVIKTNKWKRDVYVTAVGREFWTANNVDNNKITKTASNSLGINFGNNINNLKFTLITSALYSKKIHNAKYITPPTYKFQELFMYSKETKNQIIRIKSDAGIMHSGYYLDNRILCFNLNNTNSINDAIKKLPFKPNVAITNNDGGSLIYILDTPVFHSEKIKILNAIYAVICSDSNIQLTDVIHNPQNVKNTVIYPEYKYACKRNILDWSNDIKNSLNLCPLDKTPSKLNNIVTDNKEHELIHTHIPIYTNQWMCIKGIDSVIQNSSEHTATQLTDLTFENLRKIYGALRYNEIFYKYKNTIEKIKYQYENDPYKLYSYINKQINHIIRKGSIIAELLGFTFNNPRSIHMSTANFIQRFSSSYLIKELEPEKQRSIYTRKINSLVTGMKMLNYFDPKYTIEQLCNYTNVIRDYTKSSKYNYPCMPTTDYTILASQNDYCDPFNCDAKVLKAQIVRDKLPAHLFDSKYGSYYRREKVVGFIWNIIDANIIIEQYEEIYGELNLNKYNVENSPYINYVNLDELTVTRSPKFVIDILKKDNINAYVAKLVKVISERILYHIRFKSSSPREETIKEMYHNYGLDVNIVNKIICAMIHPSNYGKRDFGIKDVVKIVYDDLYQCIVEQCGDLIISTNTLKYHEYTTTQLNNFIKSSTRYKYLLVYFKIIAKSISSFNEFKDEVFSYIEQQIDSSEIVHNLGATLGILAQLYYTVKDKFFKRTKSFIRIVVYALKLIDKLTKDDVDYYFDNYIKLPA